MSEVHRRDELQGDIVHVYDGIEEADNEMPLWWLTTFYVSVVFAVGYWFAYHELGSVPLPNDAYAAEVARRADQGGELTEDALAAFAGSTDEVARGRELFQANCVSCHGDRGQGQIGPNLTDDRWLHGGTGVEILHTIREGVPALGMQAWLPSLGPVATRRLAAYVMTLRNTNVPGKAPEGVPTGAGR